MAITTETIRKITIQGQGQQSLETLAAALAKVTAAQERVTTASVAATQAQEKLAKIEADASASQEKKAKAAAQAVAAQDRLTAAQERLTKAELAAQGVTDKSASRQLSAAKAYQNQTSVLYENVRMQERIEKATTVATNAFNQNTLTNRQGVVVDRNSAEGKAALAERISDINKHYGNATASSKAFAAATSGVSAQLVAMSAGLGPLGVFLAALGPWGIAAAVGLGVLFTKSIASVEAFRKFEEEALTLNSMLQSTGFAAGKTAEDVERLATEIGNITEVRKAGIELIKFGSIAGEVFDRTLKAADDLSAAGFGSISSAAFALGKALESPQEGLTRLRRAGIIFSDSQIAMVKNMQETGRIAEAQKFILDELAKKVGGAGAARDQGLSGSYEALGDATQRLLERWGRQITVGLNLTGMFKGIASEVDEINRRSSGGGRIEAIDQRLAELRKSQANPQRFSIDLGLEKSEIRALERERALRVLERAEKDIVDAYKADDVALSAHNAAMQRSIELVRGSILEIEKETDLLRKNALGRAVDAAMRKAEVAPGSPGEDLIRRAINTKMATEATVSAIDAIKMQTESLKIESATIGMSVGAAAAYRVEMEFLAQQKIKGVTVSEAMTGAIRKEAQVQGAAAQAAAQLNAENRTAFDRQTIGLSDIDKQIASVQQQLHGNAWPQFMNDGLAATMRVTDSIKTLQGATSTFATTFAHAMIEGKSGAQALQAALKSVGSSMLDAAIKDIANAGISALFGGGTQAAAQAAGATTAATILTTAGATVAASFIAGATAAASILGIGGATAGGAVATGSALGGGVLSVAGGAAGVEVAAGGIAGGAALAIGGATAGASLWGPIALLMAAVVAIGAASFLGGEEKVDPAVEALKQAQQAWRDMADELKQFINVMNGNSGGSFTAALSDAAAQAEKYIKAAQEADMRTIKIKDALVNFTNNLVRGFLGTFDLITNALNSGFGFDSPAVKAAENIKSIGEQLKGFVQDASKVNDLVVNGYPTHHPASALMLPGSIDDPAAMVVTALEAARRYAVSLLQTAPVLSDVETKVLTLTGAAAQLVLTLQDLGMSATEAAAAVASGVTAALDQIRTEFTQGLREKINAATGKDYLNDISALVQERSDLLRDAALIGVDAGLVGQYFAAQAQAIVDSAELTGTAFDELIATFPALSGLVHAVAADVSAAAERAKSYADRLFDAENDASTMQGALLAFDRRASAERLKEIADGGQAIADLERAQAAERLNIVKDFNQKIIDESKKLLDFVAGLQTGQYSTLSPADKLAAAQQQYSSQLTLARGGDLAALQAITGAATTLLDAARDFYASSAPYADIFNAVSGNLTGLASHAAGGWISGGTPGRDSVPGLLMPREFVVNADEAPKYGPLLQAMNAGMLPHFAQGGPVGPSYAAPVTMSFSAPAQNWPAPANDSREIGMAINRQTEALSRDNSDLQEAVREMQQEIKNLNGKLALYLAAA